MPEQSEYERYHQTNVVTDPMKPSNISVEKEHRIDINEPIPPSSLQYNQGPPPPIPLSQPQPPLIQQPPYAPINPPPIPTAPIENQPMQKIEQFTLTDVDNKIIQPQVASQIPPQVINDTYHFTPEKPISILWILFITIYWTITVIAPSIINKDLTHRHFYLWCIAAVAILSVAYTIKDGKYPSGSSDIYPKGLNSIGRYSAFFLIICILIDYYILTYLLINNEYDKYSKKYFIARVAMHSIALFWISLFFYQRFIEYNGSAAHLSFWSEWIDIIISWIVIYLLHNSIDANRQDNENKQECFSEMICIAYYIFVILKMTEWLSPMFLITRWGTMPNATFVSVHLVILDLLTDFPIVIIILHEEAYRFHGILFFDVFYKILLIIRAVAYNLVYFLWMQRGSRYNNVNRTEIRTTKETVQQSHVF